MHAVEIRMTTLKLQRPTLLPIETSQTCLVWGNVRCDITNLAEKDAFSIGEKEPLASGREKLCQLLVEQ